MQKIIRNAARCKICDDVIESKSTHDFVTCSCGNVSVDGGHEYLHRCFQLDDLEYCVDILKKNNLNLYVKDITSTDIHRLGFTVVKVIIPDLQQIEADFNYRFLNCERLDKVPIKLGYKKNVSINNNPHPFP